MSNIRANRIRAGATAAVKTARRWGPLNRTATTAIKLIVGNRAPGWVVEHLPRMGVVQLDLPGIPSLRMKSGDDWLTSRVWWRGVQGFEPEVVRPFLRFAPAARAVLDVGAYTGYYSLLAARANPQARVLAFEPNPVVAARLGENLALNPPTRVIVLPYAVGDRRALAQLHLGGPGLASSSSLSDQWRGRSDSLPVATVDLDSLCAEWGVTGVDLVKIDVESREPSVLDGMQGLLERDRPVIFTEVLGGADEDYARMSSALRERGYRFFSLLPAGGMVERGDLQSPRVRDASGRRAVNHLLCPREKIPDWLLAEQRQSSRETT